jgi:hypothetical protein
MTFLLFSRVLKTLQIKESLIAPAGALLLLNPAQLAFGRYWYPDHFIILTSTIFLLACVNIICGKKTSFRNYAFLGLAFALLTSTKYTAVSAFVCFLPLITLDLNSKPRSSQIKVSINRFLIIAGSAITSFSLLNYGIFFNFSKFVSDFKFNLSNYSQLPGGLKPLMFYSWMLIVAPFGLLGLFWIFLGVRSLWKSYKTLLLTFVPFLIVLLFGLTRSGLTTSRNVAIGLPIITLLLVVGINTWVSGTMFRQRNAVTMTLLIPCLTLLPITAESLGAIRADMQSDSRYQAVKWIKTNIPKDKNIGSNEFCSGLSPGDVSGYKTTIDPTFSLGLDYYLLNSYWDSPLSKYYQSNSNQRFFHFYRLKSSTVPFKFPILNKNDYVPKGYEIVKVISGDGPEIVILKKT